MAKERTYEELKQRVEELEKIVAEDIADRDRAEDGFKELKEIATREEAEQLRMENIRLRSSIKERYRFCNIIGKSQVMQEVYEHILRAGNSNASVVIYGESGTGKELVAKAVHEMSNRCDRDFVLVNCGAIPETLIESEFFGYTKGAFTGAHIDKHGYLDSADGATLFLDEIGELGLDMQVKLLRALDGGDYSPVGSMKTKKSDFRIITATNKKLKEQVKKGLMREDFFYRIHVIPITLPPLKDRREDIPFLIDHFLKIYRDKEKPVHMPGKIIDALYNYDWPGNVRQLQNVLQRYLALNRLDFISSNSTPLPDKEGIKQVETFDPDKINLPESVANLEKSLIFKALDQTHWNRSKAAMLLGISRKALFRKMKKLG